jgi:hypothetical protein
MSGAVEALVAPLVEALLVERPLAQLPPQLTPMEAGWMTLEGDYLTWPVQ